MVWVLLLVKLASLNLPTCDVGFKEAEHFVATFLFFHQFYLGTTLFIYSHVYYWIIIIIVQLVWVKAYKYDC